MISTKAHVAQQPTIQTLEGFMQSCGRNKVVAKLMTKMGYKLGSGLGANEQGIVAPIGEDCLPLEPLRGLGYAPLSLAQLPIIKSRRRRTIRLGFDVPYPDEKTFAFRPPFNDAETGQENEVLDEPRSDDPSKVDTTWNSCLAVTASPTSSNKLSECDEPHKPVNESTLIATTSDTRAEKSSEMITDYMRESFKLVKDEFKDPKVKAKWLKFAANEPNELEREYKMLQYHMLLMLEKESRAETKENSHFMPESKLDEKKTEPENLIQTDVKKEKTKEEICREFTEKIKKLLGPEEQPLNDASDSPIGSSPVYPEFGVQKLPIVPERLLPNGTNVSEKLELVPKNRLQIDESDELAKVPVLEPNKPLQLKFPRPMPLKCETPKLAWSEYYFDYEMYDLVKRLKPGSLRNEKKRKLQEDCEEKNRFFELVPRGENQLQEPKSGFQYYRVKVVFDESRIDMDVPATKYHWAYNPKIIPRCTF